MTAHVAASIKEVSSTLHRVLLYPSNATLDGELYYEDDAWRFRSKGLDIQDFAPSFIEVYQYVRRKQDENKDSVLLKEMQREPDVQVFVYSFSYLPDPTWLVNWENGTSVDEWFDAGMVRLNEKSKNLELDMGEYLTGATIEYSQAEGEEQAQLRILSFMTNQNREFVIKKCSTSAKKYRLRLPEGFGIVGRFPAPRSSFGFYVGWMIPKQWSIRKHVWFPSSFRASVQTLLCVLHRIAQKRADASSSAESAGLPASVVRLIIQRLNACDSDPLSEGMKNVEFDFVQELQS